MRRLRSAAWLFCVLAALAAGCASHGALLPPVGGAGAAAASADSGWRSGSGRVHLAIALRLRDENALERFVDDVSNPQSPRFRHFLTPAEFVARFSPTAAQERRVVARLRVAGFSVDRVSDDRVLLDVSAPATRRLPADVAAAVDDVDAGAPAIERAGAPPWDVVDEQTSSTPTPRPVHPGRGTPLTGPTYGPSSGWAPRGVADGFDLPVQHGYNARGIGVGVVVSSLIHKKDVLAYLHANGIHRPGTFVQVDIDGGPTKAEDPTEATIELEATTSLAPGATVVAYDMPNLSNLSILDAYQKALDDHAVAIVESSFGQCEVADKPFDRITDRDALHGAAIGMTFVVGSGDMGSACYDPKSHKNHVGANAPASDPHFLSVGGTESVSPLLTPSPCPCPISTPIAWDDHNVNFGGLSGGGVSKVWPLPAYQRGLSGHPASSTNRNVPDLSFPAVDDDALIYGAYQAVDGTAWSSAIATALLAETVALCGPLGYANPAVYREFANDPANFDDPVTGFNGKYAPILRKGYRAARGYDNVTGVGMPRGFTFAVTLCGRTVAG